MGSKKIRHKEKNELKKAKNEIKQVETDEAIKKVKKRKITAGINILVLCSLLLFLWISNIMDSTIYIESDNIEIETNLREQLDVKNPTSKGLVDCEDSVYVIYETDGINNIAMAPRSEKFYNRFEFDADNQDTIKSFTKPVNYLIHNSVKPETSFIVLYGNIKDTKITNVELSYNGKTQLVPIESPTNDYFITTIEVPSSENVTTVDLKLINNRDDDVTEQFN